MSRDTIEKDGQFAGAVDTLETKVRKDLRDAALKRKSRKEAPRTTKKQVTKAGQALQEKRVEPLPFMRRAEWKDYQVIEAITLLADAEISPQEQAQVNALLDRPHIPASEGLAIVRNLAKANLAQRQRIYALHGSADPREQSLALTLAAKKAPEPDPQVLIAKRLSEAVQDVRRRQRTWLKQYPEEPWSEELREIDARLADVQGRWQAIADRAQDAHRGRIASYAEA